jgi:predicted dinucleotide-binding enzyme
VDISNPLNESFEGLATAPGTSAAEEVAAAAPSGARVVKAFNTTFSGTLVEGQVADQPLDVLIAGDDEEAKETLAQLVRDGACRLSTSVRWNGPGISRDSGSSGSLSSSRWD